MSFGSCPHLPVANPDPFVTGQLLQTHRPARADLIGANPYLGAHAEFTPIREPGRGVPIDGGGIDLAEELFGAGFVASHDAIGVGRAVVINVVDGLPDTFYHAQIQDVIVVFSVKILISSSFKF